MSLPIPFDVPILIEIWKMNTHRDSEMAKSKRPRTSIILPQNQTDRLTDLPDCLIHQILSFMETKQAAQTCLLSRRWLNLWTSVPILDFGLSSSSSISKTAFKKFVRRVLTRRRDSRLQTLVFHHSCSDSAFTKTVFRHARLRGVQEIDTNDALIFNHFHRCQSLRVLKLRAFNLSGHFALDFQCLTTLHLDHLVFCPSHIFPNLHNMHTMCLTYCYLKLPSNTNLTVPKLTNLVVSNVYACHALVLSVPLLSDFNFQGHNPRALCLADCSCLDKANIVLTHLVYSELLMGEFGQSLAEFIRPLVPAAKSLVLEAPSWKMKIVRCGLSVSIAIFDDQFHTEYRCLKDIRELGSLTYVIAVIAMFDILYEKLASICQRIFRLLETLDRIMDSMLKDVAKIKSKGKSKLQ